MPEQLETKILPLLPLNTGVVLPHMVVTVTLETAEAKAAVAAARSADDTLLLVPRTESGSYARVGTVAKIEEAGRLPNGVRGVLVRGLHRAVIGVGAPSPTPGLWVSVEPVEDPTGEGSERARELLREYRAEWHAQHGER